MLLWVIDISSPDVPRDYTTLSTELRLYKEELAARDRIILLNKIDLVSPETLAGKEAFFRTQGETVRSVSAAAGYGIDGLKELLAEKGGGRVHG
jgi:GTP-binding protein